MDGWNTERTADKLVDGLDWDGSLDTLRVKDPPLDDKKGGAKALQEENEVLRRQIEVLIQQVATGEHRTLPPIAMGSGGGTPSS
eukprot:CAMPEP_0180412142 /NCGR_PEP_ID=MMETSP0989-20121125/44381_1 /TAXON_ID=697907 /ORGANISM="non described non described, Strain CCMP2293" /LENGTH=83 /DNA_ID=CAMNT_0022416585 /DNA_START=3 /DNA_END=251 /DNA_ORIENTATION=-